jgi:hypothetical protein
MKTRLFLVILLFAIAEAIQILDYVEMLFGINAGLASKHLKNYAA